MNSQLLELLKASQALRDALLKRDADAILAAVNRQEKAAEACKRAHTARTGINSEAGTEPAGDARTRNDITAARTLADGIRRIQQTNKRVARGFLDVVDRTLASLGTGAPRHPVTYGADGWSRRPSTPVLVHQLG